MDTSYDPSQWEPIIRKEWETSTGGRVHVDPSKDPFTIVLPPPNANGSLHTGHAMYVYEDVMIRYARQQGKMAFWIPGSDHAGFETQYVFEKHLAKQGKSRFDYDRDTLYAQIAEFVASSKGQIHEQFRSIGFDLDWAYEQYTLSPQIVAIVQRTFKRLFDAKLLYRSERLVNYCVRDGTSFSDLEIENKEVDTELYHIRYPFVDGGSLTVATTRPETLFADVAVMVHPHDARYASHMGESLHLPLTDRVIPLIADDYVDKEFGTGAVKVTPSHDHNDAEVGRRHGLSHPSVIGFDGRMKGTGTRVDGMKVKPAREAVITMLEEAQLIVHRERYHTTVKTCYKCGQVLEPLPLPQWYIQIKPLAQPAIDLIRKGHVKVYPRRFKKILIEILENFIDWNVSRQVVWGIRIPAFHHQRTQEWVVELDETKQKELLSSGEWVQDPDTFDTWFSSGQWPFVTLMAIASAKYGVQSTELYKALAETSGVPSAHTTDALTQAVDFFNYFYPTTVMETGYDIARAWVARMLMLGHFVTGKEPFTTVYLHGMVRDAKGQKMSKSKGNVIDPLKLTAQYGTDALRLALIFGTGEGSDVSLSPEKVIGMRNFVNKVWNIGRFIRLLDTPSPNGLTRENKETHTVPTTLRSLQKEISSVEKVYTKHMRIFEFSHALVAVHEFIWHRFADVYIETLKADARSGNKTVRETLTDVYMRCVTMLEPFAPFVTTAIRRSFATDGTAHD